MSLDTVDHLEVGVSEVDLVEGVLNKESGVENTADVRQTSGGSTVDLRKIQSPKTTPTAQLSNRQTESRNEWQCSQLQVEVGLDLQTPSLCSVDRTQELVLSPIVRQDEPYIPRLLQTVRLVRCPDWGVDPGALAGHTRDPESSPVEVKPSPFEGSAFGGKPGDGSQDDRGKKPAIKSQHKGHLALVEGSQPQYRESAKGACERARKTV